MDAAVGRELVRIPTPTPWQEMDDNYGIEESKRKADEEEDPDHDVKRSRKEPVEVVVNEQFTKLFGDKATLIEKAHKFRLKLSPATIKLLDTFESSDSAEALIDRKEDKNFFEGEVVLVKRTVGGMQYVMVLAQNQNQICFVEESSDLKFKSSNFFYHRREQREMISQEELAHDQQEADRLVKKGARSTRALQFIARLDCATDLGGTLKIEDKEYEVITGGTQGFSSKCLASCGSSPDREIILFDPENSPRLMEHYEKLQRKILSLKADIGLPLTNHQVLNIVMKNTIDIFKPDAASFSSAEQAAEHFVRAAANDAGRKKATHPEHKEVEIPIFSLDEFIAAGKGSCRHRSMFVCIALDLLTHNPERKPVLNGIIQMMRDNLSMGCLRGAHVWTTFIPQTVSGEVPQKWHLDAMFGMLENFALPQGRQALAMYGDAVGTEIKRTEAAAKLCGQPKD